MTYPITERLNNKKILILGFGKEGQSTLRFLLQQLHLMPAAIADQHPIPENAMSQIPDGIRLHTGENYLSAIHEYDLTIKAPGIPMRLIDSSLKNRISSQTELFLSQYAPQTIGITGTKGKSTTSSLVHHLLLENGHHSLLAGNIGIPLFDIIPSIRKETIVVCEMSANQLEKTAFSPHVAILLNIFEEHLDHFGTFDAYSRAKLNIVAAQNTGDIAIVHPDWIAACSNSKSMIIPLDNSSLPLDINNPLLGDHNLININAALMAIGAFGLNTENLPTALSNFRPLPHRLEHCGYSDKVVFVNDSIATIPEACISAMQAIGQVDFLMLGGFDRGIQYNKLAQVIANSSLPHLLYTGEAGKRIVGMLPQNEKGMKRFYYESMQQAFDYIAQHATPGDVCLLSPAAASYDQYKNFEHRGDTFKQCVASFKRKTT